MASRDPPGLRLNLLMSDIELPPSQTGGTMAGLLDEYPDVDKHSCQLLGPTALIVQALMGVLVVLSLVYKRHRESPKRQWRIWLFDVSKQVVGQMFIHGVNVLVSDLVSQHTDQNACVFYFFNILVDTTLGVGLLYIVLSILSYFFVEKFRLEGFQSGVYGKPPSFVYWIKQAAIYVVALTTMKLLVLALLAVFPGLFEIGAWLLSWTQTGDGDALQVIFTMGVFPIIMNILQFWLIDSIVKASTEEPLSLDSDAHDNLDREPLFGAPSDDEDEDVGTQRHDIENPKPRPPHTIARSHSPGKSSGSVTPLAIEPKGSGSITPIAVDGYSYPPSLSSSLTSNSSNSSSSLSSPISSLRDGRPPNKKKRSIPAPLHIRQSTQPAVNSPAPPSAPATMKVAEVPQDNKASSQDWDDSWGDSEDWAERVGEEEWTGRRIEEKKETVNGIWTSQEAHVNTH